MEDDQGTRRLPANDGPLKEFLGGARRCAERGKPKRGARAFEGGDRTLRDEEGLFRRHVAQGSRVCQQIGRQGPQARPEGGVRLLTRSIQRSLENDKLQRDQEDMEG